MFRSATFQLTGLYLLIIAIISLFFSISLYQLSVRQLENGLKQQSVFIQLQPGFNGNIDLPALLAKQRQERLDEGKKGIINGLVRSDLLIIILGGIGSYFLARRTLKPIAEAHDAQVRFTADASHELRTPIAAMQLEIEVALRDKKLTHAQATCLLQSNLEELAKLSGLATGLLQLSRPEATRPATAINLADIIKEGVELVSKTAATKKIEIKVRANQNISVLGDQTSLTQLIVILLDNAIKYSDSGTKISVNTQTSDRETTITIQDQGIGINKIDLPHIFDRFYRVDSGRSKEKVDGYGLGLSIAQNIVKRHHGTITVESMLGEGSTFKITLPLAKS